MPTSFWFGDRSRPIYKIYMHKLAERPKQTTIARKSTKTLVKSKEPRRPSKWSWDTDWNNIRYVDEATYKRARKGVGGVSCKFHEFEKTPLQRVDKLICEFMGDTEPDPKRDSRYYNAMHEIGFWTLYNHGGSHIEERHVKIMHERGVLWFRGDKKHDFCGPLYVHPKYPGLSERIVPEGEMARRHALLDWVFLKKWQFDATG